MKLKKRTYNPNVSTLLSRCCLARRAVGVIGESPPDSEVVLILSIKIYLLVDKTKETKTNDDCRLGPCCCCCHSCSECRWFLLFTTFCVVVDCGSCGGMVVVVVVVRPPYSQAVSIC
jgi:hypothetical protein